MFSFDIYIDYIVNVILTHLIYCSVKLFVCCSIFFISLFLKTMQWLVYKNFAWILWRLLSRWSKSMNFFSWVTLSRDSVFSYFLPVLLYHYLFFVVAFPEKYSIALQYIFAHVLGIRQTVPSLNKVFKVSLFLLYVILSYFGPHYWYAIVLLRVISHYMKIGTTVLGIISKING